MGTLVTLAGVVVAAVAGFELLAVCVAYICGSLSVAVMARAIVRRRRLTPAKHPRRTRDELALLSSGVRLLGMNLGQILSSRADVILLGILSVSAQVGHYAVATTPAALLRIPS